MRLPRVKREHAAYRLADGRIRIGGQIYGVAQEIEDPDGLVWRVLGAMDGTRTPEEISRHLTGLPPAAAAELVAQLMDSGHVEDVGATAPEELTPRERERYSRGHAFFRWADLTPREHGWEAQLRLRQARVLLLGLGGTGGTAAQALVASGVGTLHCVDVDRVELSNLNRQVLYSERDVGRPKTRAALERLRALNSDVRVTGEEARITCPEDLARISTGFDVVALCADEPKGPDGIRVWTSRVCATAGLPWVGGGYNGPLVTVGVFLPGRGLCYECVIRAEDRRRSREVSHHPDSRGFSIDLGGPGVTAASAGISGHLVANAVVRIVTGVPEILANFIHGVNLIAPDHLVFGEYGEGEGCGRCRR
ncbi:ThiF family adenylyltransferase [Streptosporangium sp. NPDC006007]|uniref:HesA/MoeB/ThiF family protein n=1 Tax=Streptosporangium sp. NPDC006007 TaxID=3154575 RepID=UPI0033B9CF9D